MRIVITLARPIVNCPSASANTSHRIAVVIIDEDGKRGQDHLNRSVREARIFANGIWTGVISCGLPAPTILLDEVLKDTE